jgi:hypothetical protein
MGLVRQLTGGWLRMSALPVLTGSFEQVGGRLGSVDSRQSNSDRPVIALSLSSSRPLAIGVQYYLVVSRAFRGLSGRIPAKYWTPWI